MNPVYEDAGLRVFHGSNLDVLATIPDGSYDSIVTDPPYELGFMGKGWDSSGIAYDVDLWRECLRVLKPGGFLLAFGGSRTWHRLAAAVEDAGFELRDSIAWLYGSGFPKSLDVSKAIDKAAGAERPVVGRAKGAGSSDTASLGVFAPEYAATESATDAARVWEGWGTALKPAFEPIVVARRPLAGTVASNVLAYGTGALNIDATRIATDDKLGGGANTGMTAETRHEGFARPWMRDDEARESAAARSRENTERAESLGRWPTNVVLDESQAAALDEQSGTLTSGAKPAIRGGDTDKRAVYGGFTGARNEQPRRGTDSGGASRFFPVFRYEAKAPGSERPEVDGVQHATVKPLDLMRWLVRLVTRPGGRVLDLFAGSGTTGEAALLEGMECDLIELEQDHIPLILARVRKPLQPSMFGDWDES